MHFLLDPELIFCPCWCSKFIVMRNHFIVVLPWLCFGFCCLDKNNETNGSENSRANEVMFWGFVFDSLITLPFSPLQQLWPFILRFMPNSIRLPSFQCAQLPFKSADISCAEDIISLSSSELLLHWHAGRILADWVARGQSKKVTAELSLMFYS